MFSSELCRHPNDSAYKSNLKDPIIIKNHHHYHRVLLYTGVSPNKRLWPTNFFETRCYPFPRPYSTERVLSVVNISAQNRQSATSITNALLANGQTAQSSIVPRHWGYTCVPSKCELWGTETMQCQPLTLCRSRRKKDFFCLYMKIVKDFMRIKKCNRKLQSQTASTNANHRLQARMAITNCYHIL